MLWLLASTFLLLSILHYLWRRHELLKQLPPLATKIPIWGDARFAGKDSHELAAKTARRMGSSVFTVEIKGQLMVMINDAESAKELFVRQAEAYAHRPNPPFADAINGGNIGLLVEYGSVLREQRRFAMSTLRDLGFGKPIIENSIQEEAETLLQSVAAKEGNAFDIQMALSTAVGNVISRVVFGRRFEEKDGGFNERVQRIADLAREFGQTTSMKLPYWLQSAIVATPWGQKAIKDTQPLVAEQLASVQDIVEERRRIHTPQAEETPETYVDAFVQKQIRGEGEFFHQEQLIHAASDLFAAGVDTTTTTIRWILSHMLREPELQERAFLSIKEAVGLDRLPELEDRPRLPLLDAIIAESMRLYSLVPYSNRRSTAESRLGRWILPSGTIVFSNLYAISRDPKVWDEPGEFRPQRFLDSQGRLVKEKVDAIHPFGFAKRKCLGESLARAETFLLAASLLQRFKFESPAGQSPPKLDDHFRCLVLAPHPFKLCATPRFAH